jgi:hypothetical protein
VFWLVMTIIDSVVAVSYLAIGASGAHLRISGQRRAIFHRSGILAIGLAFVAYGHLLLARRR